MRPSSDVMSPQLQGSLSEIALGIAPSAIVETESEGSSKPYFFSSPGSPSLRGSLADNDGDRAPEVMARHLSASAPY